VDKCNLERLNDSADLQGKVGLLGKSASRHLDRLKQQLVRQAELLSELAGKPGSVLFSAYRDEGDSGGECYLTFSGTNSNIGGGFTPKSGIFLCPEPGLYLFSLTVCTYDGKKCLLILRRNEADVCALIDQDGNENRGKTMVGQTCILELEAGDRVQVYAVTGTGYTDTRSSHYTQWCGCLLRPAAETLRAAARGLQEEEELSVAEGGLRGMTPTRGFTPGPEGSLSRRGSKKERRFNGGGGGVGMEKALSPPPAPVLEEPAPTPAPVAAPQQSYLALTKLGGGQEGGQAPGSRRDGLTAR